MAADHAVDALVLSRLLPSQLRNVCTTDPILEKKISTTKYVFVMTFVTLVLFGIKFRTERCVTHRYF